MEHKLAHKMISHVYAHIWIKISIIMICECSIDLDISTTSIDCRILCQTDGKQWNCKNKNIHRNECKSILKNRVYYISWKIIVTQKIIANLVHEQYLMQIIEIFFVWCARKAIEISFLFCQRMKFYKATY